ncbi:MAG TPA: hypothetical protein VGW33_13380 [Terriglobia bacterium]|nr:hypothetical protein [Terriglobia bacterium]
MTPHRDSSSSSLQPENARRALCLAVALAATCCVLAWQALTVHYTYHGNWTGLFCTGSEFKPVPAPLRSENIYIFQGKTGYDGQEYHYIAHDPLMRRGFSASLENARFRYRRILVEGLAFLLAFGRDRAIDTAYFSVIAGFILLGSYWLARFSVKFGYSAWLGLLFPLVPAVLASIDRMVVDAPLAACSVAFALYTRERSPWKLYAVLVAAALTRETGLLLIAAYALYLLSERRLKAAVVFSTAAVPTLGWYAFVHLHTGPGPTGFISLVPLAGLIGRMIHPVVYHYSAAANALLYALDYLALGGVVAALVWAFRLAYQRVWNPVAVAIYLFAALTIALGPGDPWVEVLAFGRSLTPLFLLIALEGLPAGQVTAALPIAAMDPRIVLEMGRQVFNVVHGILR